MQGWGGEKGVIAVTAGVAMTVTAGVARMIDFVANSGVVT